MEFTATYYLAKANSCCQVVVTYVNDEIVIQSSDTDVLQANTILYQEKQLQLSASPKLGNLPREIPLPDGSKLVVGADIDIDNLLQHNSTYSLLHNLEKNKISWIFATILMPVLLYLLIAHAIPSAAKQVAPLLGPKYSKIIDKQVLSTLDYLMLEESKLTIKEQETLEGIWSKLLQSLDNSEVNNSDTNFQLLIRNSEELGANAFALPGGTIVITDQLFSLLNNQPQAITAVLLHEMGHVKYHHSIQMVAEAASTTLLMSYFFGDLEGVAEIFSGSALTIVQNNFSRELEREADQFAIKKLKALGISPQAFADALTAISSPDEDSDLLEQYFSSHPMVKERIEQAKSAALQQ